MRNLIFLLLGFVSSSALAQTSVFKVSKGNQTIYIGGTVHILRAEDYPLPEKFEEAYKASDVLTFETDTKSLQDPALAQQMMAKGMFQDERTIQTVLADTTYAKLEEAFKTSSIPLSMLQKMKPAMLINMLSALSMKSNGMTEEGVDLYFSKKASEDNKEIHQLETTDDQINRITSMGDGKENEFVNYSLEGINTINDDLNEMIESWKTGASKKMEEEIKTMKVEYPDTYTSLLVERNNNWMPKILSYLENGTKAFVLVGSLHLYGPDGLLELLKNQHYIVEQL